jgi:hypothetical protein
MTRLLLCGVYKPYGISDETSDSLCTMELLNNQVTREQGFTPRVQATRVSGFISWLKIYQFRQPCLDFPTWEEFTGEIDAGAYSHVGISFIIPNVIKAKKMAEYIRTRSPGTKIIIGGHGTAIPGVRELVPCDEICHGEGVAWLRNYFGEKSDRPIRHPVLNSSVNSYVYGAPIMGKAA